MTRSRRTTVAKRPRIAMVGRRLGGEFQEAIRVGGDRFDYVVVSMELDESLRSLVEWRRIPKPGWHSFRLRWAVFFVLGALRLRSADVDLIHAMGPTPIVPNRVDLNTVTYCHAEYRETTAGERFKGNSVGWRIGERVALALERWWFRRRVRVLVGISRGSLDQLRRHYPTTESVFMPLGIDLQRFRPNPRARAAMRAEQSIADDDVVALCVDQDQRELKGTEIAIEAFVAARELGGGPKLLWVLGAGNERYAPLAERLGIMEHVRFFGYRTDVERFFQAADVFVLPSAYETFCRAAHEAAACGLPVVAPALSGLAELIGDDEAGIMVARKPDGVARALRSLASDPSLRQRMGEVGRRRARRLDHTSVGARIVELHASQLEAAGQPAR